jgi:hypothetical protein
MDETYNPQLTNAGKPVQLKLQVERSASFLKKRSKKLGSVRK